MTCGQQPYNALGIPILMVTHRVVGSRPLVFVKLSQVFRSDVSYITLNYFNFSEDQHVFEKLGATDAPGLRCFTNCWAV